MGQSLMRVSAMIRRACPIFANELGRRSFRRANWGGVDLCLSVVSIQRFATFWNDASDIPDSGKAMCSFEWIEVWAIRETRQRVRTIEADGVYLAMCSTAPSSNSARFPGSQIWRSQRDEIALTISRRKSSVQKSARQMSPFHPLRKKGIRRDERILK